MKTEFTIKKAKYYSKEIIGKEIENIIIDYYFIFEHEWGRKLDENSIVFDKLLVKYGKLDLIETLVIHECCHLKFDGHGENFVNLFQQFSNNDYDIIKHPLYRELFNLLKKKGFIDNEELPIKHEHLKPTNPILVKYMKESDALE